MSVSIRGLTSTVYASPRTFTLPRLACSISGPGEAQPRRVRIGGLRGRIRADDSAFDWPDPEIQRLFYGEEPSDDDARTACEPPAR